MTIADTRLFKTATGGRLHLAECPHVLGAEIFPASAGDIETVLVCSWCHAELNDEGRTYHDTIEDALRDMGAPEVSIPELKKHLSSRGGGLVYVPFSRSYVAVAIDGRPVAVAGKTYVWFRDGETVLLPDYIGSDGGGAARRDELWGETCPISFTKHPLNGACEWCL